MFFKIVKFEKVGITFSMILLLVTWIEEGVFHEVACQYSNLELKNLLVNCVFE